MKFIQKYEEGLFVKREPRQWNMHHFSSSMPNLSLLALNLNKMLDWLVAAGEHLGDKTIAK